MRRLRLRFALFAVALLGPVALLVQRAVSSAALEREMRHRALAERFFDEMERNLSRFLEHEEESAFRVEVGEEERAEFPFLVSRFEGNPADLPGLLQGQRKKERLRDSAAGANGEAASDERLGAEVANEGDFAAKLDAAAAPPGVEQKPGSTLPLGAAAGEPLAAGRAEDGRSASYDAFRALNKAVEERVARQKMAEQAERKDLSPRDDEVAPRRAGAARNLAAPPPMPSSTGAAPAEVPAPLTGGVVAPGRIVLSRAVVRDGRLERQGVVLTLAALEAWLRERALSDTTLAAHAELAFTDPFAGAAPARAGSFLYRHRFAEPFADLSAELALQPLPGLGSAAYVYLLSALLVATAVLGLGALYRMVAVVVSFAERRGNFVAAVTHELKTPLTAIRMYGEMLRDGMVPTQEKREEYYKHITVESERLSRLINNVLEFSRLERGNRDMALVCGDVAAVLREAVDLLGPHVGEQGFTLCLEIEPGLPAVRFERDALLQVLFNLIDNAVKYARDAADRRILLAAHSAGAGVRIAVRDRGPGVEPRHLGSIFQAFYRGENELTRRSKGTGLGLALVRGLVERMGGDVRARNRPEGGFEVEIELR